MRYFELVDRLDSRFSASVPKGTNIQKPGGCPACATISKDGGPPEILRVIDTPANEVISFTSWGFGVIATKLLAHLGNDFASCLRVGKLAGADGNIFDGFRTFVGVERIVLRGNRESEHRVCDLCNAMLYTYLPRKSPYLTRPQIASELPVYEIESMRLLVNESIRIRIGDLWKDAINFNEVPILETPIDGLSDELGLWPTEEQLKNYQPHISKFQNQLGIR